MSEKAEEVGGWGCRRGWTRVNVLGQCGGRDGGNRKSSRGGHGGGRGDGGCSQWAVVWRRVGADVSPGVLAWSTQGTVVCRRWLPKQSSSVTDQQAHAARSTRLHRRRGALRKRGGPASCDSLSLHARALRRLAQREAQCFSFVARGFLASKLPRWRRPPIGVKDTHSAAPRDRLTLAPPSRGRGIIGAPHWLSLRHAGRRLPLGHCFSAAMRVASESAQ